MLETANGQLDDVEHKASTLQKVIIVKSGMLTSKSPRFGLIVRSIENLVQKLYTMLRAIFAARCLQLLHMSHHLSRFILPSVCQLHGNV